VKTRTNADDAELFTGGVADRLFSLSKDGILAMAELNLPSALGEQ
jgi:hypothetical protein